MKASVVVCTRNRAAALATCLESLARDRSSVEREVIVVDNGSTDDTRAVVEASGYRYAYEPRAGHSHARNHGVRVARGELILFTDDDVEVEDGWADALAAAFADPSVAAAGGRILPRWPFPPPAWMEGPHAVHLTLRDLGEQERLLGADETPLGANMAFRRAALEDAGCFDPRLGHRPGSYRGGDEAEAVRRVRAAGAVAYRPDAIVHHLISPERVDFAAMRSAWFHGGVVDGRLRRLGGERLPSFPRRAVRTFRTYRAAVAARRRNAAAAPTGASAWEEFYAYMWAGRHVEMLLGRFPRLCDAVAGALERVEARVA